MEKYRWTKQQIETEVARLEAIQPWWHDIELPYGIFTRGRKETEWEPNHNVPKWQRISPFIPRELRRVIDLGCNEGYFCLKLIEMGVQEVVGVDISPNRIEKAHFIMDVLQVRNVRLIQDSVSKVDTLKLGLFDFALCLGLVHRVPDPYVLLAMVSELTDSVILEWSGIISHEPIMRFWGGGFKSYDAYNSGYWQPSRVCVKQILERHGFRHFYDIEADSDRAILLASRNSLETEQKRRD